MKSLPKPAMAAIAVPLVAVLSLTSACTTPNQITKTPALQLSGALESFDSCETALADLKAAAHRHVGTGGFAGPPSTDTDMESGDMAAEAAPGDGDVAPDEPEYSGTNVQEAGVDEPDQVKTDGERIVTVRGGSLVVVSAETKQITGELALEDVSSDPYLGNGELLLHGDRALVITTQSPELLPAEPGGGDIAGFGSTTIRLVDLAGEPTLVNTYTFEGAYLDARAVDRYSRVVMRSAPQLPYDLESVEGDAVAATRQAIDDSTIEDWLPRYSLDGSQEQVDCAALARPTDFSAASTLTVLSFDLLGELDSGSPVSIEADGQTVYGAGEALYIANDRAEYAAIDAEPAEAETEIYRFGIDEAGPPVFESSAKVPGYLLNQYSMSESNGYFRVATTQFSDGTTEAGPDSASAVYVLAIGADSMVEVGSVTDLGIGERIHAVRFVGETAYVVTFKETDPLYTLDLSKPDEPIMTGELKITGYSAYLHPVDDERLLGVGQEATTEGVTTGTQVSLFDVSDATQPRQADKYELPGSYSAVETDPHAFLYWPERALVAIPVDDYGDAGIDSVLLTVGTDSLTEAGRISHDGEEFGDITRTMVISNELWTLSHAGLKVADINDYHELAWLPFDG